MGGARLPGDGLPRVHRQGETPWPCTMGASGVRGRRPRRGGEARRAHGARGVRLDTAAPGGNRPHGPLGGPGERGADCPTGSCGPCARRPYRPVLRHGAKRLAWHRRTATAPLSSTCVAAGRSGIIGGRSSSTPCLYPFRLMASRDQLPFRLAGAGLGLARRGPGFGGQARRRGRGAGAGRPWVRRRWRVQCLRDRRAGRLGPVPASARVPVKPALPPPVRPGARAGSIRGGASRTLRARWGPALTPRRG